MPTTSSSGARGRPLRFLHGLCPPMPPTPQAQRALTLECTAARVLHRVALLRGPAVPPSLVELARSLHIRMKGPAPVTRLVPWAQALCQEDPEGVACRAAMVWLEHAAQEDARFGAVLHEGIRTRERWHKARAQVVCVNLRLAASVLVRRFARSPMAMEDMFQEAVVGLSKAADRFDPTRGFLFSTYATWWIRHAVQRAVINKFRLVRLPAHVCEAMARHHAALAALGSGATDEQIATHTGLSEREIRRLAALRSNQIPVSLDHSIHAHDEDGAALLEMMAAPGPDPVQQIQDAQRSAHARALLRDLPERSREILSKRFGVGQDHRTLLEIGHDVGLSRERVRQIQKSALHEMSLRADRAQALSAGV